MKKTTEFAVIFDLDGVIVDSNPAHKIALRQFCSRHGYQLSDDELKNKIYGRTNRDWLSNLFEGKLSEEQIKAYSEEKELLFREIFAPIIKPVKGLPEFLNLLKQNGIATAIATSAPAANVEFTLNRTGLSYFFDTIIDESQVKSGKPHPEIYLKAAGTMGFPPEMCIVFEDSLAGITSAKAAGCIVIGITTTHTSPEMPQADKVIDSFDEVTMENLVSLL